MEKEIKEIKCNLIVRGSDKANAVAKADLEVKDPDKDRALAILDKAFGEEDEQDEQRGTS